jgi:uncharacterized protein YlaI
MQDKRLSLIVTMLIGGKTYGEISKAFDITRQRVQQIVKPNKETLKCLKERAGNKCEYCGDPLLCGQAHHIKWIADGFNELANLKYLCTSCHLRVGAKQASCIVCDKSFTVRNRRRSKGRPSEFCSQGCHHKAHYTTVICLICGKQFDIANHDYKKRMARREIDGFFCSRHCHGKWWGKMYGNGRPKIKVSP